MKQSLTIGIDASRAFREQRTGVEEYAFQLLKAMAATTPETVSVRLYVPKSCQLSVVSCQFPSRWEFRLLRGPSRLWTHTALAWELFRHSPDVFFQPSHVFPVCLETKSLNIITIHDIGFERIPWAYSRFERWYQHTMTKLEVRGQRSEVRVIVPSDFTKQELVELYRVDPAHITVIAHATTYATPTSYKLSSRSPEGRQATSSLDPCGHHYILSIGRIEKKKNTLGMVKWFEGRSMREKGERADGDVRIEPSNFQLSTSNLHYLLVGPEGYGATEVYAYLAKRPEVQARVHLLGYVSEQRKQELLKGAQALLHLSHYEGFGLPIVEAKAMGIPVIMDYGLRITDYDRDRTWRDVARDTWKALCVNSGS